MAWAGVSRARRTCTASRCSASAKDINPLLLASPLPPLPPFPLPLLLLLAVVVVVVVMAVLARARSCSLLLWRSACSLPALV